jgi:hydroxymethylglutaryl-CoA reductase (NADPH)
MLDKMGKNIKLQSQPFTGVNSEEAKDGRVSFLKELGMNTTFLEASSLKSSVVKSNIESFVGCCDIPLGLVGPIRMMDADQNFEDIYTVAGTSEGALIASMNRGAALIRACGGFNAHVEKQRMLRAPMFCFENIFEAKLFSEWIVSQLENLRKHIKKYSSHANLIEIKTTIMGKYIDCKFYYETGDASGQNMTTICTWHSCLWIEEEFNKQHKFNIKEFVLDGNGSSDKKVSHATLINGRGIDVVAECIIDEAIIRKRLKTTSNDIVRFYAKSLQISTKDGMIGANVNVANSIAAIFVATGQDIACLAASSVAYLHVENHERGLYISLKIPRLVIGTIGGGTGLPGPKSNLELMGCYGTGKIERFAKLIAGFSMGLELSTISAIVSGQFAIAHERLGRNKPVDFVKLEELNTKFFEQEIKVKEIKSSTFIDNFSDSNGIITELSSKYTDKFIGLSLWNIETDKKHLALLKSKPNDRETLNCMYILTGMIDPALAKSFMSYQDNSDFNQCHKKEVQLMQFLSDQNNQSTPKIYGTYSNDERECYYILMEFLQENEMKIFNTENKVDLWSDHELQLVIKEITKTHHQLDSYQDNDSYFTTPDLSQYEQFSTHSINVLKNEYGKKYSEILSLFEGSLCYLQENEARILKTLPKNLVHNDFNPRNIAISVNDDVKIYDWELGCFDIPHRDILELVLFVSSSKNITMDLNEIFKKHLRDYNSLYNTKHTQEEWDEGYKYAFSKFMVTRLNIYMLGNKLSKYDFLDSLMKNIIVLNNEVFKI